MATLSVGEIQSALPALTFLNDAPISVWRLNCCPKSKNAPTASAPILGSAHLEDVTARASAGD